MACHSNEEDLRVLSLLGSFAIFLIAVHNTVQPTNNSDYRVQHVIPFENVVALEVNTNLTVTEIVIEASPGGFEPGSFVLTAFRDLKSLTLTPTDLKARNLVLPKENIHVQVLKICKQAGSSLRRTKPIEIE